MMDRVREHSRVMTAIAVAFVIAWILRESGGILLLGELFCTRCSRLRCKVTDETGDSWFSSMLQEKRRGDDKTKTCGPDRGRINVHEI